MPKPIDELAVRFAERLRSLRGDRSQAGFAAFLGVSHQQTYQRYEAGQIPSGAVLHSFAVKCGVTVDWLLGGSSELVNRNAPGQRFLKKLSDAQLEVSLEHSYQQLARCDPGLEPLYVEVIERIQAEKMERTLERNPKLDRMDASKSFAHFSKALHKMPEVAGRKKERAKKENI